MQDIMAKLQEILSTKEGQNQLNNIASMLNQNQPENQAASEQPQSQGFDMSSIASLLGGLQSGQQQTGPSQSVSEDQSQSNGDNPLGNIDMNMILTLQKAMSGMNVNDKNSQLLKALKPHFNEKRQAKVDQAMTIMRLISMLPLLKDSGILKGIL